MKFYDHSRSSPLNRKKDIYFYNYISNIPNIPSLLATSFQPKWSKFIVLCSMSWYFHSASRGLSLQHNSPSTSILFHIHLPHSKDLSCNPAQSTSVSLPLATVRWTIFKLSVPFNAVAIRVETMSVRFASREKRIRISSHQFITKFSTAENQQLISAEY